MLWAELDAHLAGANIPIETKLEVLCNEWKINLRQIDSMTFHMARCSINICRTTTHASVH